MSVNTNGHTVYAHESLPLNEIVDVIHHSEHLISKFAFLNRGLIYTHRKTKKHARLMAEKDLLRGQDHI